MLPNLGSGILPGSRPVSSAKHRKNQPLPEPEAVSRNPSPSSSVLLEPKAATWLALRLQDPFLECTLVGLASPLPHCSFPLHAGVLAQHQRLLAPPGTVSTLVRTSVHWSQRQRRAWSRILCAVRSCSIPQAAARACIPRDGGWEAVELWCKPAQDRVNEGKQKRAETLLAFHSNLWPQSSMCRGSK